MCLVRMASRPGSSNALIALQTSSLERRKKVGAALPHCRSSESIPFAIISTASSRLVSPHEGCRLPLIIGFLPLPVDPIQMAMACSLRSTSITLASALLRSSPPLTGASVLSALRLAPLVPFPWHRRVGSHVPYKSLVELRAAYTPDAARAVSGVPQANPEGWVSPRF